MAICRRHLVQLKKELEVSGRTNNWNEVKVHLSLQLLLLSSRILCKELRNVRRQSIVRLRRALGLLHQLGWAVSLGRFSGSGHDQGSYLKSVGETPRRPGEVWVVIFSVGSFPKKPQFAARSNTKLLRFRWEPQCAGSVRR